MTARLAKLFNLPTKTGLCRNVTPGSGAAKAGFHPGQTQVVVQGMSYLLGGDILVGVDGHAIQTYEQLRDAVAQKKPGDKIELDIYRHGSKQSVTVTLGQAPRHPPPALPVEPIPETGRGRACPLGPRPVSGVLGATLCAMERGQIVFEQQSTIVFDADELWEDDENGDHDGWFCVRTDPFPCPASGCSFIAEFMTAAHLILVWETTDDPNLLKHAARARDVGRNPRVTGYRSEFGPSASYYAWVAAGRRARRSRQHVIEQQFGERAAVLARRRGGVDDPRRGDATSRSQRSIAS